jgi:iron complex transport system permease protein
LKLLNNFESTETVLSLLPKIIHLTSNPRFKLLFLFLGIALFICFFINLSLGSVSIPLEAIFDTFTGNEIKKSWEIILWKFRLPKAITAVFVGAGLSVAGLLMQTLFRNPLAGPYVLGITSGASLGVALLVMGSSFLPLFLGTSYALVIAAALGSALVLWLVLWVSKMIKDTMSILIVGLMFGSFTSAIVSVLAYFSSAEELQKYTFWSMGSLSNLTNEALLLLVSCVVLGLLISMLTLKSLNALLLGEQYAQSMGIPFRKVRWLVIIATGLLAGSVTAFAGPIAFVGLAIPHLARLLFQTSHHIPLFVASILMGAILMLICDSIAQLPGSDLTLPINAITSLMGAPIVIWLLIRKRKLFM